MRHTRYPAFTYVPLTNTKPIACPRCKRYVHLIQRVPLPAGLKGEMCTFECKNCGKQKIIVQDKAAAAIQPARSPQYWGVKYDGGP